MVDQLPLSRRIEELGAGLIVEEDAAQIRDAVRLLLDGSDAHAHARNLRDHLLNYDGEARVAAAVDQVLPA